MRATCDISLKVAGDFEVLSGVSKASSTLGATWHESIFQLQVKIFPTPWGRAFNFPVI
jgi:hypothetical protein